MPYNRPGVSRYVTNGSGGTLTHGQTVKEGNHVGVAIKQEARAWSDGYSLQATIDTSEAYLVQVKGVVQVTDPGLSSPAVGDAVYITSGNVITKTSTSNYQYGRIVELAGTRGTPTGKVRIDLDAKPHSAVAAAAF